MTMMLILASPPSARIKRTQEQFCIFFSSTKNVPFLNDVNDDDNADDDDDDDDDNDDDNDDDDDDVLDCCVVLSVPAEFLTAGFQLQVNDPRAVANCPLVCPPSLQRRRWRR